MREERGEAIGYMLQTIKSLLQSITIGAVVVEGELLGGQAGQVIDLVQHPLERNVAQLHVGVILGLPAAAHVAMVTGKLDLRDVLGGGPFLAEEGGPELELALVDRHAWLMWVALGA